MAEEVARYYIERGRLYLMGTQYDGNIRNGIVYVCLAPGIGWSDGAQSMMSFY